MAFADMNEEGALAAATESKKFAVHDSFEAIAIKVDIAEEASVDNMVQITLSEFGRIDYSVNCAGVYPTIHMFPVFGMTDAVLFPDLQSLFRGVAEHRRRHVLSYP